MYTERTPLYREIERSRDSKVIAYVTGDRLNLETMMRSDVLELFVRHLDAIGTVKKISLILYTQGGETLSAWSIANLLRSFCQSLEIIIPSKCRSAGTLLSLGADTLVMTKQATLGPIDPSVNTHLNPAIPGDPSGKRFPVSVEDVNAFLEQARSVLDGHSIEQVFDRLAQSVHPLVLGRAFRTRSQIRMLGKRLLSMHMQDQRAIDKILDFLCSDSGSHDYTLNRREARQDLGLPIETPSEALYQTLIRVYGSFVTELELHTPFRPSAILQDDATGAYAFRRAIIESLDGGADVYVTEGTLERQSAGVRPGSIINRLNFEGWKHE